MSQSAIPLPTPREFIRSLQNSPTSSRERLLGSTAIWRWQTTLKTREVLTRAVDIAGASIGLLLLSPLLLTTAAAIFIESPGPVLFTQQRVGLKGRLFTMFKFRSMCTDAEAKKAALAAQNESKDGVLFKMKADPRITRVGRLIRRLSIDELPQLLNVLKGDMSIVGPRPAVPKEVALYDMHARKRLQTKPGLTCLWQISGRSDIPFRQQVELDLLYMQSRSIGSNVSIIAKTVPAVLSGKGAY